MKEYMMPETIKQTRKVVVYCFEKSFLTGFKFFNGNNTLIFEVGNF